jgi:hypothetical protein
VSLPGLAEEQSEWHSAMIAKDFHLTKDFRQIRGKSFVIMDGAAASTDFPRIPGR